MNEIKLYEFEGRPVRFEQRDGGDWWLTAQESAEALGYSSANKLLVLYRKFAKEFLPSETAMVDLRGSVPQEAPNPGKPCRGGNRSRVRLFSLGGLEHLAILGRGAKCVRFRRWLLDVARTLRDGGRLVTADQVAGLYAQCQQLVRTVQDLTAENRELRGHVMTLATAMSVTVSGAAKLMSHVAHDAETRRLLHEAREQQEKLLGQRRLFGDDHAAFSPN